MPGRVRAVLAEIRALVVRLATLVQLLSITPKQSTPKQRKKMSNEIDPQQFGELRADTRNTKTQLDSVIRKVDVMDAKLDTLISSYAEMVGEHKQRDRYHTGVVSVVSAVISGGVAWFVDTWRHN
jgi:hypothetical protein